MKKEIEIIRRTAALAAFLIIATLGISAQTESAGSNSKSTVMQEDNNVQVPNIWEGVATAALN